MISVVIPTHNRPDDLLRALRSLAAQSCRPAEVIVVDDGSQPPVSAEAVGEVCGNIEVALIHNASPKGANHARNAGVRAARADWVAFLDDDDEFDENKICCLIDEIKEDPDCDVLHHAADIRMVKEDVRYRSRPRAFSSAAGALSALLVRNEIGGTSMVTVRKAKFLEAGGFDETFPALQDYEMWIRLAREGARFRFIDQALTRYHHITGKRSISKNLVTYHAALAAIDRKYASYFSGLTPADIRRRDASRVRGIVHRALMNGDISLAWRNQWRQVLISRKLSDFLAILVIPLGAATVFRLRSWFD